MTEAESTAPSAESPLAYLTRVNNQVATNLIAVGNLKEAFFRLQDAIRQVSSTLASKSSSYGPSKEEQFRVASYNDQVRLQGIPSVFCDSYGMVPNSGMIGCSFRVLQQQSNENEVTARADEVHRPSQDHHRILQQVAAITIFNMALVCQLRSLDTSSSCRVRESLLIKSLILYNQAHQLWEDEASPVYLSLCQNCLTISLEFGIIEEANQWKNRLFQTLDQHYPVCPLPCVLYQSAIFAASQAA